MGQTNIGFGCSECGGKEAPNAGRVPVARVIEKLDGFFAKNDMEGAGRHLAYWHAEAVALGDLPGELSVVSEELGYFRKMEDAERGLAAVARALELTEILGNADSVSGATVLLNAATTLKAFGKAAQALPLYERVEAVYKANLPKKDARMGGFYNNKALALADLKQYPAAEACYFAAIGILFETDPTSPDIAVTYVNMAHLQEATTSDPVMAEFTVAGCLDAARQILEDERTVRNSYYAYVCMKCAPSYDHFGYFSYAARLQRRAEKIYEGA